MKNRTTTATISEWITRNEMTLVGNSVHQLPTTYLFTTTTTDLKLNEKRNRDETRTPNTQPAIGVETICANRSRDRRPHKLILTSHNLAQWSLILDATCRTRGRTSTQSPARATQAATEWRSPYRWLVLKIERDIHFHGSLTDFFPLTLFFVIPPQSMQVRWQSNRIQMNALAE